MKAAALADLPMHPGRRRVVTLHPVDTQIMFSVYGAFGVDERERIEVPAIFVPELKKRYRFEIDPRLTGLQHRSVSYVLRSELQGGERYVPKAPKLFRR